MHLEDVDEHSDGGELLVTHMALEVLGLLVLYQNLLVLELLLAVRTPHFVRFLLRPPHGDGTSRLQRTHSATESSCAPLLAALIKRARPPSTTVWFVCEKHFVCLFECVSCHSALVPPPNPRPPAVAGGK